MFLIWEYFNYTNQPFSFTSYQTNIRLISQIADYKALSFFSEITKIYCFEFKVLKQSSKFYEEILFLFFLYLSETFKEKNWLGVDIYLCSVISEVMVVRQRRQVRFFFSARLPPPGLEDFLLNCHCLALTLATSRIQKRTLISSQE